MGEDILRDHDILIRLDAGIFNIAADVKEIKETQNKLNDRVVSIEVTQGQHTESLVTLKKEVDTLRIVNTTWSTLNSLAVLVAGAVAAVFSR